MNRDLTCIDSTIADTADQQGTLRELLLDLIVLFAAAMKVTLRELTVQVQLTECDATIHQQADH